MPETSPTPAATNSSTPPSPSTAPATPTTQPTTPSPATSLTEAPVTEAKAADTTTSVLNEAEPEAPKGAPEKYEDWKLPEGLEFQEGQREAVETLFKDSNISQETGQKLLDFYHENIKKAQDSLVDFYVKKQDEWRAEIKADPKLGPRMNEIKANFSRALDATVPPEQAAAFKEAMDYTGAGNNPAFVRVIDAWAKMLTEGKHVEGGQPSPAGQRLSGQPRPTAAQAMYPNLGTST